uniref:PIH1D1/2/3 CS-like domain-containing protein n=1 Tax=Chromera velia CCMP2878 TaxID=1169474 RepID=A0A0G4IAN0_9ALVE|eukprot:Cvel_12607.t1-p1 / transcript=Cvel_12607.t1 / gene=Cvel_12607 / organism=Chromera_velia_CCMP2878 / gene_product=Protein PIH1D3, putative / transcript_product=Protein PIH1D3, putative / location=Cvel_scaffold832:22045-22728(+) / protein_length=228 / sequence_SO=supercontig / SO=protein_coding / is_pseudo=false
MHPGDIDLMSSEGLSSLTALLCPEDTIDDAPLPPSVTPASFGPGGKGKNEIAPPNVRVKAKVGERSGDHSSNFLKKEKEKSAKATKEQEKKQEEAAKKADSIWDSEELGDGIKVREYASDDRVEPEYDIMYRQKIGSEDVFLGISDKDNSSDHCEEILVKIHLPGVTMRDVSLEVFKERLLLQSPKHRLNLPFPYHVKKNEGNAKWDKPEETLRVVLPIERDVQYVHM